MNVQQARLFGWEAANKFCYGSTTTLPEKHACSDARHEWRVKFILSAQESDDRYSN